MKTLLRAVYEYHYDVSTRKAYDKTPMLHRKALFRLLNCKIKCDKEEITFYVGLPML